MYIVNGTSIGPGRGRQGVGPLMGSCMLYDHFKEIGLCFRFWYSNNFLCTSYTLRRIPTCQFLQDLQLLADSSAELANSIADSVNGGQLPLINGTFRYVVTGQ